MNSAELNAKIQELDNQEPSSFDAFGGSGKPVPYIGWYWRDVDFDRDECWFGVIPAGADGNSKPLVGFMENNKWGYGYLLAQGETWQNIRALLEKAVRNPTPETLTALNDAIQALAKEEHHA